MERGAAECRERKNISKRPASMSYAVRNGCDRRLPAGFTF